MSLFKEEKVIYDSRIDSELAMKINISNKLLKEWPKDCLILAFPGCIASCYYALMITMGGENIIDNAALFTIPLGLIVLPWCATPFLKMRNKQLKYQYKKKFNAIEKSKSVEEKMEL